MTDYPPKGAITKSAICAAIVDDETVSMAAMHDEMIRTRNDSDATPAMRLGTLAHMVLLEPVEMLNRVVVWTGKDKKGNKWEAFKGEANGRTIVTKAEVDRVINMRSVLMANTTARGLIARITHTESPISWTDSAYGLACGRPDFYGNDFLGEYKTCRNISKFRFLRECKSRGYDMGLAWYWEGLRHPQTVVMIAQQNTRPYSVACFTAANRAIEPAYNRAKEIAVHYRACELTGRFPHPYDTLMEFELPSSGGCGEVDVSTETVDGGLE